MEGLQFTSGNSKASKTFLIPSPSTGVIAFFPPKTFGATKAYILFTFLFSKKEKFKFPPPSIRTESIFFSFKHSKT